MTVFCRNRTRGTASRPRVRFPRNADPGAEEGVLAGGSRVGRAEADSATNELAWACDQDRHRLRPVMLVSVIFEEVVVVDDEDAGERAVAAVDATR